MSMCLIPAVDNNDREYHDDISHWNEGEMIPRSLAGKLVTESICDLCLTIHSFGFDPTIFCDCNGLHSIIDHTAKAF